MAMDGIRGYLQLASGLVELSRAKATEAAAAVLALPGSVADSVAGSVAGGVSGSVAGASGLSGQVQDLAEELMAAAAANRRSLLALIRAEIESALGKAVVVPVDELDRARAAVAKLSADVEELRDQVLGSSAVRSIPEPGRSALTTVSDVVSGAMSGAASSVLAHGASLTRTEVAPTLDDGPTTVTPRASSGRRPSRSAVKAAATSTTPTKKAVTKKAATKKATSTPAAPARKATTKKTATKASTTTPAAKKAATTKAPTKKAATTKTATKKAATKKAATTPPAKKAATTAAKKAATTTATKKAATKRTATTKAATTGGTAG